MSGSAKIMRPGDHQSKKSTSRSVRQAHAKTKKLSSPTEEELAVNAAASQLEEGFKLLMGSNYQAARQSFEGAEDSLTSFAQRNRTVPSERTQKMESLTRLCNAMKVMADAIDQTRILDFEQAKDNLTRARNELTVVAESGTLPNELIFFAHVTVGENNASIVAAEAMSRFTRREFSAAADSFDAASQRLELLLKDLQSHPAPPNFSIPQLTHLYAGLGQYYAAWGRLSRAQSESDSGRANNAIALGEEASKTFDEAKENFIAVGPDVPQAATNIAMIGNIRSMLLPVYIIQFKSAGNLQEELSRLKADNNRLEKMVDEWQKAAMESFGRPVSAQAFVSINQTFKTEIQDFVKVNLETLAKGLDDLPAQTRNSAETTEVRAALMDAANAEGPALREKVSQALHKFKSLLAKLGAGLLPLAPRLLPVLESAAARL